jgi:phenylalanyl-tRNA synthetase beta chain
MLPTALEVIAFNLNRKNSNLKFFEFGKTYSTEGAGKYSEQNHLCLYITGSTKENHWKGKAKDADIYYVKGVVETIVQVAGLKVSFSSDIASPYVENLITADLDNKVLARVGKVATKTAAGFDIKGAVYFANFNWDILAEKASKKKIQYKEITKYPLVERDLAMVVSKTMKYAEIKLFDIFENEKLGNDKKSMAINFTFFDEEKTLTDKEIDGWMNNIISTLEKDLGAEIRK